jgi:hypothetical protein
MVKTNHTGWTIYSPCSKGGAEETKGGKRISNGCEQSRGKKAGRAGEGGKARWIPIPSRSSSAVPFSLHASACVAIDMTAPKSYKKILKKEYFNFFRFSSEWA